MIELAAPRPLRPDQTHRRFAHKGEVFDLRGERVPIRRTDAEIALDNLRDSLHARIESAFDGLLLGFLACGCVTYDAVIESRFASRAEDVDRVRGITRSLGEIRMRGSK